jgi:hypothetical protein
MNRLYQTAINIRADYDRKIAKIASGLGIWKGNVVLVHAMKA